MADKKYIGWSAKAVTTQFGEILNLSLKLEDMQEIANDRGYVNMSVMKRREPGQYGDTHYVVENDYMKNREWGEAPATSSPAPAQEASVEVPF